MCEDLSCEDLLGRLLGLAALELACLISLWTAPPTSCPSSCPVLMLWWTRPPAVGFPVAAGVRDVCGPESERVSACVCFHNIEG